MINLLSKSTEKTQRVQENAAAMSFLLEEESKLRMANESKISSTIELNSLEDYRKKGLDLSSTTKNLSFEKPSAIYS